ncbi:MAG: protein-L-isoaspartate O-methyltransferase, partial [Rhodospirillales bacterium]|nr:protein-L-isoaspartate O-methyltransferase [Rhodospirillales bacterium]
ELLVEAQARLAELRITNVTTLCGDGALGWPHQAPFDRIMVTAAAPSVPAALVDQLAAGGVLVTPVARSGGQRLIRVRRTENGSETEDLASVNFVPLV